MNTISLASRLLALQTARAIRLDRPPCSRVSYNAPSRCSQGACGRARVRFDDLRRRYLARRVSRLRPALNDR